MRGAPPIRLPATVQTASERATEAAGEALASLLGAGDVVALVGPLGAGKTCFARGLVRGLGAADPVASPTFALVREYRGRLPVQHVDLYRLEPAEVEELDWRHLLYGPGVAVVEWADKARRYLPERHVLVRIAPDPAGDSGRRVITMTGLGARATPSVRASPAPGSPPPGSGLAETRPTPTGLGLRSWRPPEDPRASLGVTPSRVLAIDTSTRARSLAVVNDGRIHEAYWPPEQGELQAEDLAASLRELLREGGLVPGDLELVAVALGPGSFTGVKVGLASAKALAYALGCSLKGVGTLDILAEGAFGGGGTEAVVGGNSPVAGRRPAAAMALIDAKRGDVFGAAYLGNPDPLPLGYLVGPEADVVARLAEALELAVAKTSDSGAAAACGSLVLTGDWAPRISDRVLVSLGARWEVLRRPPGSEHPLASDLLLLARRRFLRGARVRIPAGGRLPAGDDPFALQPLYLRDPGVTAPAIRPRTRSRTPASEGGARP